ncbi:tripartite ATP-independent transporter DctP family solute receptor [Kineosphaera limosa]|nr:tripartite ATP-independent transporter DctP family solute receptor [Kineosphaera limosa]
MVLSLAHSLGDTHPTSKAIKEFAEQVQEDSGGRLTVEIFGSGVLGSETEVIEQVMAGVLDMTRVASPGLGSYEEGFLTFGLPYVFEDEEHFYAAMDSPQMREFFGSTQKAGFVGLTYYTSGARSFYTRGTPVRQPQDLNGLKIRVQDFRSQIELMEALGGTPVVMAFGDVYTALQTGIIDGAESNETALTNSNHGEVAKEFSYTRHTMIPDMLVISTDTWQRLTDADREVADEGGARLDAGPQGGLAHRHRGVDSRWQGDGRHLCRGCRPRRLPQRNPAAGGPVLARASAGGADPAHHRFGPGIGGCRGDGIDPRQDGDDDGARLVGGLPADRHGVSRAVSGVHAVRAR